MVRHCTVNNSKRSRDTMIVKKIITINDNEISHRGVRIRLRRCTVVILSRTRRAGRTTSRSHTARKRTRKIGVFSSAASRIRCKYNNIISTRVFSRTSSGFRRRSPRDGTRRRTAARRRRRHVRVCTTDTRGFFAFYFLN